jgi:hypothetical protein
MLEPIPAASRPPRLDERGRRSTAGTPTLRWSDSSPAISSLPPGHSMVRNPDHTLAMYRTMSVTPVAGSTVAMQRTGSNAIGRSVSPPGGIGSDDELGLDEVEGGGDTPTTRQTRVESHAKNSPASPYRDPRKTAKVSIASRNELCMTLLTVGFALPKLGMEELIPSVPGIPFELLSR